MNLNSRVTVILPVRNEGKFIHSTLDAVLKQDYPSELIEIIIVDGMSTDNTREIIKEYQKNNKNISLLDNPDNIVPKALNIGIRKANGEIIIRIDGHTIINQNYIKKCVEVLYRTQADNCGGCMNAVGNTTFGKAVAIATSTPFGIGNSRFHYSTIEEEVDTVYMGAWHREVFNKIGMFDEELVRDQDDEFNYRLKKSGGKIVLNPEIKSQYFTRSSPTRLFKQYFQYGLYKVRVLQKHPRQMSLRHFIPPLFVLSLLISIFLSIITNTGWIILTTIAGSYLLADFIASILTAMKKGWNSFLFLPVTFAIIHLSYGTGFLVGLFRYWNRWADSEDSSPIQ